jgi:hypothetical protein
MLQVNFMDEQPVGGDMTFLAALPGANELVVFELRGQALSAYEHRQHRFQALKVVSTPAQSLQISLELPGISWTEH